MSKTILNHIKIQGTAFNVYGLTHSLRIYAGKISVGDRETNIKAITNKIILILLFSIVVNHNATPDIAIIKVGDSAL